jgi:hypothetical protein
VSRQSANERKRDKVYLFKPLPVGKRETGGINRDAGAGGSSGAGGDGGRYRHGRQRERRVRAICQGQLLV